MTAFRTLLFLIAAPGVAVVYVPVWVFGAGQRIIPESVSYLALPFWAVGAAVILACCWEFVVRGEGTPAPIDPPRNLVSTGLYRYVRNPMYIGVVLALAGHFLWFGTAALLFYMLGAFAVAHVFVILYEEPNLRRRFGAAYEDYLRKVPRWIPAPRPPQGTGPSPGTGPV